MTEQSVWRLIAEIKANYRYTYKGMTDEEMKLMAARWQDCLKAYTDEQVESAFKTAICKLSTPPTVADIIGIISRQERLLEPRDMELWQKLVHSIREICQNVWDDRRGYRALWELHGAEAKEVYKRLPIILQEYCDFDSFCDMGGMTDEELRYERARFLKAIPEIREILRERRWSGIETNSLPRIESEKTLRIGTGKN